MWKCRQTASAVSMPRRSRAIAHQDRKSTRLNSSHTEIYTLSLHDALPISARRLIEIDLPPPHVEVPTDRFRRIYAAALTGDCSSRSEEHTSELQSHRDLHSFPTRCSSDLCSASDRDRSTAAACGSADRPLPPYLCRGAHGRLLIVRSRGPRSGGRLGKT